MSLRSFSQPKCLTLHRNSFLSLSNSIRVPKTRKALPLPRRGLVYAGFTHVLLSCPPSFY